MMTMTSFVDDFTSGELDRSVWSVELTGRVVNDEVQAYVDDPATVSVRCGDDVAGATGGHALVLQAHHRPGFVTDDGQRFDFVSGRLTTRGAVGFRYGTASARMKLPAGHGLWPAFWALGDGPWPGVGEIDIMECIGDPAWTSAGVHGPGYCGEAGLVNRRYFPPGTDITDWHVYAVERTPDALAFTVDGELVYRATRPMTEFFGDWAFDDDKFLILNLALGGTYPYKVNGVREPYHGLGAEAVDTIQYGGARVVIDWVRVDAADAVVGTPVDEPVRH